MKIKYLQIVLVGMMTILYIGSVFIAVPNGYAQSLQNWSDPVNLSQSGSATNPIMVVDASGTIHVIWIDSIDDQYKYVQSKDGLNWAFPLTVNFPFPTEDSITRSRSSFTIKEISPVLVPDDSGLIHIFWRSEEGALLYSKTLTENLGKPSAWSGYTRLVDTALDFDVALDSQGTVHVGFLKDTHSEINPAGIYYRQLIHGRQDWSKASLLYESQYFRGLKPENAHVRLAVSSEVDAEKVYVVWDDRPQKRIFLAASEDGGKKWLEAEQIEGPENFTGIQYPFSVRITAFENTAILSWQVGQFGLQCSQYSQTTLNGGGSWSEPVKVLNEITGCPEKTKIFSLGEKLSLVIMDNQGETLLIAWNGMEWSEPQLQSELSSVLNPVTFDSVLLGCQQFSLHNKFLYVVGCDQGTGGDIWFTSRLVGSTENWFPPPTIWSLPKSVTNTDQKLSSLNSVADVERIHLLWVQSSQSELDEIKPSIQYSRWNGKEWSRPGAVISGFSGVPLQMSVIKDWEDRLLATWIDGETGEIFFSWANAERANLPAEWTQPQSLPVSSQLNSSPDLLVDAAGRIAIAYAVPLNEERGIYITQSTDFGETWSQPVKVFDAVSAGWQMVDLSKIELGGDGRLHVLFIEYTVEEGGQPVGLYYSQSVDGGTIWSPSELIRERDIRWSGISYNEGKLHRLWQEKDGEIFKFLFQISQDEGLTWTNPTNLISGSDKTTVPALATDPEGKVRFVQVSKEENPQNMDEVTFSVQDHQWDGTRWIAQENKRNFNIKGDSSSNTSLTLGITAQGYLNVSILVTQPEHKSELDTSILSLGRTINLTSDIQSPLPLFISTPEITSNSFEISEVTDIPDLEMAPPDSTQLAKITDAPPPSRKNLVGFLIVGVILFLILIIVVPTIKRKTE